MPFCNEGVVHSNLLSPLLVLEVLFRISKSVNFSNNFHYFIILLNLLQPNLILIKTNYNLKCRNPRL